MPPSPIPPPPPQTAAPIPVPVPVPVPPPGQAPQSSQAPQTGQSPQQWPTIQSLQPGGGQVQFAPAPANGGSSSSSLPPRPAQKLANGFVIPSPYRTAPQNRRLLDALALRTVLGFGYEVGTSPACRLAKTPGVETSTCLVKQAGPDFTRTLELALSVLPTGERDIVGAALDLPHNAAPVPNPDLDAIFTSLQAEATTLRNRQLPQPEVSGLNSQFYDLSYIDSDSAIAALKALGYTSVEYHQEPGENTYDKIYQPVKNGEKPPIIVKMVDPEKTSILQPAPQPPTPAGQMVQPYPPQPQVATVSAVPEIGGTFLHHATEGEPAQRLLILYDPDDPESLQKIVNLLRNDIDVPARQVMIDALVIEINENKVRDLGISVQATQGQFQISSGQLDSNGVVLPTIVDFDKDRNTLATFKAQLSLLVTRGEAEILSNPSVLVLDGRQARIQIGQQVPVVKSVSTQAGIISSVDYFPVGIVLNLRPHISDDGSEITMQTETIVSAVNQAASAVSSASQVLLAPVVDNRQVQSFVRVADATPFIIGGLIATDKSKNYSGVPLLSEIPGLGNLFRRTTISKTKQEVIIVVTPHVVPLADQYLSYVIPQDSQIFDRLGYSLFRNAYRVRSDDVFDLKFVSGSKVVEKLQRRASQAEQTEEPVTSREPLASLAQGRVPGEDILVRRMLWEIVQKTGVAKRIETDHMIFFENRPDAADGSGYQLAFLADKLKEIENSSKALTLSFKADPSTNMERPFAPPIATLGAETITPGEYSRVLADLNRRDPAGDRQSDVIVLGDNYSGIRVSPLDVLKGVLVMKRILQLNSSMALTLNEFHVGRQIIFPTDDELHQRYQIIDRETAQSFYEVINYYPAFEQEFTHQTKRAVTELDRLHK